MNRIEFLTELAILLKDIASSGAHVQKAAIVSAITILGTLKLSAIDVAASTNTSENLIIKKRDINNTIKFIINI